MQARDNIPKKVASSNIDQALNRNQSETCGLAGILQLKVNARVMLAVNVDQEERLMNGQLSAIKYIQKDTKYIYKIS